MARKHMRSPFARASGLGSAKEGVEHCWQERVTTVALVPLTLWFVASIIAHGGSDYTAFIAWLRMPFSMLMMVLLLAAMCVLLLAVGASLPPALRAASIDPMQAMRGE